MVLVAMTEVWPLPLKFPATSPNDTSVGGGM
jgi:hypothetical protein